MSEPRYSNPDADPNAVRTFTGEMNAELELWLGDAFNSWLPSRRGLEVVTRDGMVEVRPGWRLWWTDAGIAVAGPSIAELIEASSLGTPEAVAARASVSDEDVAVIMARVRQLEGEAS